MTIQKLSDEKKAQAIRDIVASGLNTPNKRVNRIKEIRSVCQRRIVFYGVGDCMFLGMLIGLCAWLIMLPVQNDRTYSFIFLLSPILYIATYFLTTWKEHILQLYELKMSCKYTMRQVMAFRMMYFGSINLVLNAAVLLILKNMYIPSLDVLRMLGVSFVAVLLYGILLLLIRIKNNQSITLILTPVIWFVSTISAMTILGERFELLVINASWWMVFVITALLIIVYSIMMLNFLLTKSQEELTYA